MNFLAHLLLADGTAESLIGNLAGDFVKGPLHDRFTPGIRAGIAEHRKIDAFTDSHPNVAAFRRVLTPDHGHYSRVIADVFLDHFLARSFDEFGGQSLESFVGRVHATLDASVDSLPGNLQFVYPRMRDQQWLLAYREIKGVRLALARTSHRLSRRPHLEDATHHLVDSRIELERRFRSFFPDVVKFAASLRHEQRACPCGRRSATRSANPFHHRRAPAYHVPMKSVQETYAPQNRCFGCGPSNDKGLRIQSFEQGEELVADWTPQPHHLAFEGVLNGGICGALLDCHGNWAAIVHLMKKNRMATPPSMVTADFHVVLKRPTPNDTTIHLRAHVVESTEDRAVVDASIEANGKVTATCRGTFVAVKEGHPAFHRW